ncbi:hypothetical protein GQ600_131 [Phytophthora cactorum]|nr:hypothetical protein GQ600_131 [Phytophthora cactorum]
MVFGDSIFDPVPVGSEGHDTGRHGVTSPMTRTEVVQNDGLSDSDDDVVDPDDVIQSPTEPATKLPTEVDDFSVLVGAVEVLSNLVSQMYKPVVQEALHAALAVLRELRVSKLPLVAASRDHGVVDDRLDYSECTRLTVVWRMQRRLRRTSRLHTSRL